MLDDRDESLLRLTWIALSVVSFSRGDSPLGCPEPVPAPGVASTRAADTASPHSANVSDPALTSAAASTAVSPRFVLNDCVKVLRFTF
ncbi:hypothetical protein VSH64_08390 [Amycolatopsis rhabdoformis]|uniref:Secreted protein n=1 Tax=Amycolatopsis rhabdoformis TaxID=1448059 RepID=A0ABZ1IF88_9PSEU|nr:hypothetical protein [Amycolatopsis rhabdoformis]WSE32125.1 hypothetical protein VSH64_08390 [Amycolatopsis rhabdoformis]